MNTTSNFLNMGKLVNKFSKPFWPLFIQWTKPNSSRCVSHTNIPLKSFKYKQLKSDLLSPSIPPLDPRYAKELLKLESRSTHISEQISSTSRYHSNSISFM